jgi:hypothetical protein
MVLSLLPSFLRIKPEALGVVPCGGRNLCYHAYYDRGWELRTGECDLDGPVGQSPLS